VEYNEFLAVTRLCAGGRNACSDSRLRWELVDEALAQELVRQKKLTKFQAGTPAAQFWSEFASQQLQGKP